MKRIPYWIRLLVVSAVVSTVLNNLLLLDFILQLFAWVFFISGVSLVRFQKLELTELHWKQTLRHALIDCSCMIGGATLSALLVPLPHVVPASPLCIILAVICGSNYVSVGMILHSRIRP